MEKEYHPRPVGYTNRFPDHGIPAQPCAQELEVLLRQKGLIPRSRATRIWTGKRPAWFPKVKQWVRGNIEWGDCDVCQAKYTICHQCKRGVGHAGLHIAHSVPWLYRLRASKQYTRDEGKTLTAWQARIIYNDLTNLTIKCRTCNSVDVRNWKDPSAVTRGLNIRNAKKIENEWIKSAQGCNDEEDTSRLFRTLRPLNETVLAERVETLIQDDADNGKYETDATDLDYFPTNDSVDSATESDSSSYNPEDTDAIYHCKAR